MRILAISCGVTKFSNEINYMQTIMQSISLRKNITLPHDSLNEMALKQTNFTVVTLIYVACIQK